MASLTPEEATRLRPFATERQAECIDAVLTHGSATKAAPSLGVNRRAIDRSIEAVRRKAAVAPRGSPGFVTRELTTHYDPDGGVTGSTLKEGPASWADTGGVDAGPARDGHTGYAIKGVSTYYDAEGNQRGQWVKTRAEDVKREEMLLAVAAAMGAEIPRAAPLEAPAHTLDHLLTLYSFFDYHVGMLAWHKEGGADWDLTIAERTGVDAMRMLVGGAPASDTAIINIGGDFLHFDGLLPVTPTHGHVLDADSRFGKVVDVAIRLIRQLVALALQKHRHVILLVMEGNHDLSSSLWLRKLFACLYENEARVTVHASERPYYAIEWGVTMLGFHHGHLKKNDQLPALFAAMFREMWGRCSKVYLHTGHRHHLESKDHTGARVTQHPTLAAMDAHASRHGYFTEREITAVTYNRFTGQAGTNSVSPEMLALA